MKETILQIEEMLCCDSDEIINEVNQLNLTEYWVENEMLDLCEDNDVMRKVLKDSFNKFMDKFGMLGGLK